MEPRLERAQASLGDQLLVPHVGDFLLVELLFAATQPVPHRGVRECAEPEHDRQQERSRKVRRYCRQKSSGTATPVHISSVCAARHPVAAKTTVATSTAAGNGQRRSTSRSTIAGPASTAGMPVTFV